MSHGLALGPAARALAAALGVVASSMAMAAEREPIAGSPDRVRRALEIVGGVLRLLLLNALDWSRPRAAERLRAGLEDLGPAFVKVGQLLSLHAEVPEIYRNALRGLLDATAPLAFAIVERVLREELGERAGGFADLDPEPLASASLGQVHRARLLDGRPVVVKVQRPGVAAAMQRDLALLERLGRFRLVAWALRTSRAALEDVVAEVRGFSLHELDYRREAAMQDRFRALGLDGARTPLVYTELSTARVLTSEFLPGFTVNTILDHRHDAEWLRTNEIDLDRLAARLARLQIAQALEHGFFQADPHPANLIVMSDAVIGYVDFGIVGELDDGMRRDVVDLVWYELIGAYDRIWPVLARYMSIPGSTDWVRFQEEFVALSRRYRAQSGAGRRGLGSYVEAQLRLYHRHRIRMTGRWATYLRAVLVYGNTVDALSPRFDFMRDTLPDYLRLKVLEYRQLPPAEGLRAAAREILLFGTELKSALERAAGGPHETTIRRADRRLRCGVWCALALASLGAAIVLRHDATWWPGGWSVVTLPATAWCLGRLAASLRRLEA